MCPAAQIHAAAAVYPLTAKAYNGKAVWTVLAFALSLCRPGTQSKLLDSISFHVNVRKANQSLLSVP